RPRLLDCSIHRAVEGVAVVVIVPWVTQPRLTQQLQRVSNPRVPLGPQAHHLPDALHHLDVPKVSVGDAQNDVQNASVRLTRGFGKRIEPVVQPALESRSYAILGGLTQPCGSRCECGAIFGYLAVPADP